MSKVLKCGITKHKIIAEQKLRTQRVLGELIKQGQERGEIKTESDNRYSTAVTSP